MKYNNLIKALVEELLTEAPKVNLGAYGSEPLTTNIRVAVSGGANKDGVPHVTRMLGLARELAKDSGIPGADSIRAYAADSASAIRNRDASKLSITVPTISKPTKALQVADPKITHTDATALGVAHEVGHIANKDLTDHMGITMRAMIPQLTYNMEYNAHKSGEELMRHVGIPHTAQHDNIKDVTLGTYVDLANPMLMGKQMQDETQGLVDRLTTDSKKLASMNAIFNYSDDLERKGGINIIKDGKVQSARILQ